MNDEGSEIDKTPNRRPPWLKVKGFGGTGYHTIRKQLRGFDLHTVCEEANCPNRGECFNSGTATFLLMGPVCSRNCRFCNVSGGRPLPLDVNEPEHVAGMAAALGLNHVVITSVTRDDLPDQGAAQFRNTVTEIKRLLPEATIEILTPDFNGRTDLINMSVASKPTVFNHNVETVPRLYPRVRPQADYRQSLDVLAYVARTFPEIKVKSGLMVGLGEEYNELHEVFDDLAAAGVTMLTIGQYLPPSSQHYPLDRYYTPEEFDDLGEKARLTGIPTVVSAPLVRSSYKAGDIIR